MSGSVQDGEVGRANEFDAPELRLRYFAEACKLLRIKRGRARKRYAERILVYVINAEFIV